MRFRTRVEVLFDADSLEQAQGLDNDVTLAAASAVGPQLARGAEGQLASAELEPVDEQARAALAADDLGPGISSSLFEYGRDNAFDALTGRWEIELVHPLVDGVAHGTSTFEWLDGGRFLIQRSSNDHELLPDSIAVIGPFDVDDEPVLEYFDSRGVRRTYGVSLEDGVLRMWRDAPGFDQRFSASLGEDSFEGQWQLAETPGDWRDDLKISFRRRA
jgi:hypothetical protein